MAASADVPVKVVDRVTLPRAEVDDWLAGWERRYRPLAEARGFTLEGVWQTRATPTHAVEVVVEWRLPDVRAFFRARAGGHDAATARWWADTDAIALDRTRSVMGPAS